MMKVIRRVASGTLAALAMTIVFWSVLAPLGLSVSAPPPAEEWGIYEIRGVGVFVASNETNKETLVCSLSGGGLCEGDNEDRTVADAGARMIYGPYPRRIGAVRAYCDTLQEDTIYVRPLATGTFARFTFDGKEHDIENGPSCDEVDAGGEGDDPTGDGTDTTTTADEAPSCTVRGRVTDRRGAPVADVRIWLTYGENFAEVATGSDGRYKFDPIGGDGAAGFDSKTDRVKVSLRLEDFGHEPRRFSLYAPNGRTGFTVAMAETNEFRIDPDDDEACKRDFDVAAGLEGIRVARPPVDVWPDEVEIYQRMQHAFDGAEVFGARLDYGLPLTVFTFAGTRDGRDDFAYWLGTTSNGSYTSDKPYIALGDSTSLLSDGGWPDNREYHEFGHHFLADALGNAMPSDDASTNHAGYYLNPSTTDAWTEGFAEYYSMMVSKHVDHDRMSYLYRLGGSYIDLEANFRAWFGLGWGEELAVAGALLDLEDGPSDYAAPRKQPKFKFTWHVVVNDGPRGKLVVGKVAPTSLMRQEVAEATTVAAVFLDAAGKTVHVAAGSAIPWDIEAGEEALFVIPFPGDLRYDRIALAASVGRSGAKGSDDDPVDLDVEDLWTTIQGFTSKRGQSAGYTFDAEDLYRAVSAKYGGDDTNSDGIDDIDQVFISHGLFADVNGDRSFRREEVGPTSHPKFKEFDDMIPRVDLEPLPASVATFDVGVDGATALVHTAYPKPDERLSTSYVTAPDKDGRITVSVPQPETDATVTVVALADGRIPRILGTVQATDFWDEVDSGDGEPFLEFKGTMRTGDIQAPKARPSDAQLELGIFGGGAALTIIGFLGIVIRRRRRK